MVQTTKKVLVTGAAGFIGSHLTDELVRSGYQVTAIDDLSTGRISNLESVLNKIEFIEGSLNSSNQMAKLFTGSNGKYDCVFHLAAVPSVVRSIEAPRASHENNIDVTFNLLMAAKENGVKRFVYSGSSSAYGQQMAPEKDESLPIDPISPYALQKWVGEKYSHFFNEFFGLETVSLRYFNVFGPRQNPNSMYSGVIPRFAKLALNCQPVTIHGDGTQARDFTYVKNVVDANIKAMLAPKECCGRTFNVAMGQSISLLELVECLERILGHSIGKNFEPPRRGDIKYSKASVELAKRMLGFRGEISFMKGLETTVEYIKQNELG